jgi:tetratricopeptide (TPR) repeat protein
MRSSSGSRPNFADVDSAELRKGLAAGTVVLFVPFCVIGYLLCLLLGIHDWRQAPVILGFGGASALVAVRFGFGVAHVAGQAVARFIAPSGSTTPYQYGYSYQQALAARGDVAGALESYEAVLRDAPADVEARLQAAELYAASGNPTRAMELFRALRTIPRVSAASDIYASNRLVDLHMAANDDGRALVELRRIVERYPGTDAARGARAALGLIKSEREQL